MTIKAVMFDLDGTLLNSLPDLAGACNTVLQQYGYTGHLEKKYGDFVGGGLRYLVTQALPLWVRSEPQISACLAAMRELYGARCTEASYLYSGIPELLKALEGMGISKAILTNKPHEAALKCVDYYLHDFDFLTVLGQKDGVLRKPDPSGALGILTQFGVLPNEVLYVGDTAIDMETAKNAGFFPLGVAWGFRPDELSHAGALEVAQTPADVLAWLQRNISLFNDGV